LPLAATSQALMDTPILEDRPALPPTTSPAALEQTPIAKPMPAAVLPVVPSKPVRIVIPDIEIDMTHRLVTIVNPTPPDDANRNT
jgi:hypothetical protein